MYENKLVVFKNFVIGLASLSKCTERHVAAIITDHELQQVYSIGINGGPKYGADCMCLTDGKYGCIHAEINALIKCTAIVKNKIMIVSLSPCKQCAAAIINAPGTFGHIYYIELWKDQNGIKLLLDAGIKVQQL
jgi:deoxycytidylate deaminase